MEDVSDYHRAIAARGAYVAFDHIRKGSELSRRVEYVIAMKESGLLDQVLLSHDMAFRADLSNHGGEGLTLISSTLVPMLMKNGLDEADIDILLRQNPQRALSGASRPA